MATVSRAATKPTARMTDTNTRARLRRAPRAFTLARPFDVSGLYERLARSRSWAMSWSGIVTLRDSAVIRKKGPKAIVCRMDRRLHGSFPAAHRLGYVFDREVGVVAQHDGHTLTRRQLSECCRDRQPGSDILSRRQSFRGPHRGLEGAITAPLIPSRLANGNDKDPGRRSLKA